MYSDARLLSMRQGGGWCQNAPVPTRRDPAPSCGQPVRANRGCSTPYARDMFGNPEILGFPIPAVVLGLAIVGSAVGIAWLLRITRGPDDSSDHWRYRR